MGNFLSQTFPPKPTFTETNVGDLKGKVYIVTGGSSGVGKEVAQILYAKNGKVYVAARSESKIKDAISDIKSKVKESSGDIVPLLLDLGDLTTIKKSANEFLSKEDRLDVLFNNAGVMIPPQGSKTAQGYDMQLGTNNVGPFLFTQLLTTRLVETAKVAPAGSVRVTWVSSSAAFLGTPTGGLELDNLDYKRDKSAGYKYGISKAGNVLHAYEYARRHKADGVVSTSLNPGNLKSELQRHVPMVGKLILKLILYPTVNGAYTELFAGLSPEAGMEKTGAWIAPWGRFVDMRQDIVASGKEEGEGGTGLARKFWEWSEEQVKQYQ
ncbi:MAG: hypothetical protein Q9227_007868 [Pyrenula ochraceoflavens]